MREARYAAYAARRAAASAPTKAAPSTAAEVRPTQLPDSTEVGTQAPEDVETLVVSPQMQTPAPAATISPAPSADPDAETQLCGHRNIGNKSCRRPAGHAEKNHRYK
jgi:hypothetical protein